MQHNRGLNLFCCARISLCSKRYEVTLQVNFQNIIYDIRYIKYVLHLLIILPSSFCALKQCARSKCSTYPPHLTTFIPFISVHEIEC